MPDDPTSAPSRSRFWLWAMLLLICASAFLLVLVQGQSGVPFTKTVTLEAELKKSQQKGKNAYRVRVPKAMRAALTAARGRILENGKPLPHAVRAIRLVEKQGYGRYRIAGDYIYLSATDNSDPRTNGMVYELRAPRVIKPALFWLSLLGATAALFMLIRHRDPPPVLVPSRRLETALAGLLALIILVIWQQHHSDVSDGWLVVNGMPASDARGWVEVAQSLADGRGFNGGFEAHRGGYGVIVGAVFALIGGGSVAAAKYINVLLLTLAATLIFTFARSAFGSLVAWILLAAVLLGERYGILTQYTLTEPVGFAVGMIGLHQIYLAAAVNRPLHFLLAGIFLALSNITRPFTLLALPVFGLILLILAIRGRWGIKPFLLRTALYVGGAFLVFGPWVLKQKLAWNVATLDLNSAVMLYGAAQIPPEDSDGKRYLDSRHYEEGVQAGIAEGDRTASYHYFKDRYKETVANDPAEYFSYLRQCFVRFFEAPGLADPGVRASLGAAFFLALGWLAMRLRCAPLLLLGGTWPLVAPLLAKAPAAVVLAIAACLSVAGFGRRGRIAISLLAASLLGAGTLNAMVGNFALDRGTVFIEWITLLLCTTGIFALARIVARIFTVRLAETDSQLDQEPATLLGRYTPVALLAVLILGLGIIGVKTSFYKPADAAAWQLPATATAELLASARANDPNLPADDSAYFSSVIELGEFRHFAPANRDLGHFTRALEVRPFARTIVSATTGYREDDGMKKSQTINIPGDLRDRDQWHRNSRFALLGLKNIKEGTFLKTNRVVIDALLLAPIDTQTGQPDLNAMTSFSLPPDFPVAAP